MMPELSVLFQRFALAGALGLMIGVEREREKGGSFAGIRTFPLITLTGCTAAMMNELFVPWVFIATFLVLAALVLRSYVLVGSTASPGITTEVTSLLAYLLGGLVWWKMGTFAAALTVLTVLFLSAKKPMEQLAHKIGRADIIAALQFGIITLIILPVVPNATYGPLNVLNPYKIWLMVVLISAVNLIGYLLARILGSRRGIGLAGFVGGFISSTAVTLGFSRNSRTAEKLSGALAFGILLACTIMFPRVLLITFSINAGLAYLLFWPTALVFAAALAGCAALWIAQRAETAADSDVKRIASKNPLELWPAIQFGILFGCILFISKAAQEYVGTTGVYISSALAGMMDVDPIVVSLSNLAGNGLDHAVAARGIVLAMLANTLVKMLIAASIGVSALRWRTTPAFLFTFLAGAAAVKFLL